MALELNSSNFEQEVLSSDMPTLVDFWAPWCGPCRMVGPIIDEIAKEYDGKIKVCKVNVDDMGDVAAKYNVASIPTLMVFKNGEVTNRQSGARPKAAILQMLD